MNWGFGRSHVLTGDTKNKNSDTVKNTEPL